MSDIVTQETEARLEGVSDAIDAAEEETNTKKKTLDDLGTREYFAAGSEVTEKLQPYMIDVERLAIEASIPIIEFGGDELPSGHGVMVAKLQSTVEHDDGSKTRRTDAIVAWPYPDVSLYLGDAEGTKYVAKTLAKDAADQVLRAFRGKSAEELLAENVAEDAPVTLQDFITRAGKESALKVYNSMAPGVLKYCRGQWPKSKTIKLMNPPMLRECLSSKVYAQSIAPELEAAGMFTTLLGIFKSNASEANLPFDIFDRWAAERDQVEEIEEEFDFANLEIKLDLNPATTA
jgi:hypothetical protein|tara:strand:+ start:609 stop:1478 length:870 start_codon:yes stop_codon:yes gene_type:complete